MCSVPIPSLPMLLLRALPLSLLLRPRSIYSLYHIIVKFHSCPTQRRQWCSALRPTSGYLGRMVSFSHSCLWIMSDPKAEDLLKGLQGAHMYTNRRLFGFRHTSADAQKSVWVRSDWSAANLALNQIYDASYFPFHFERTSPLFHNLRSLSLTQFYGPEQHSVADLNLEGNASLIIFLSSRSGLSAFAIQLSMKQRESVCKAFGLITKTSCIDFTPCSERFRSKILLECGHTGASAHSRAVPEAGYCSVVILVAVLCCHAARMISSQCSVPDFCCLTGLWMEIIRLHSVSS